MCVCKCACACVYTWMRVYKGMLTDAALVHRWCYDQREKAQLFVPRYRRGFACICVYTHTYQHRPCMFCLLSPSSALQISRTTHQKSSRCHPKWLPAERGCGDCSNWTFLRACKFVDALINIRMDWHMDNRMDMYELVWIYALYKPNLSCTQYTSYNTAQHPCTCSMNKQSHKHIANIRFTLPYLPGHRKEC